MHICICNLAIIGSDNGLPSESAPSHYLNQCWNIVDWTLRNKLQWNFNKKHTFSLKMHLKTSSAKQQPFCFGLNVLNVEETGHPFGSGIWWRHEMESFSALLAICAGKSTVHGELPAQRPVTRSCDVFFDLRLNQRLSKLSKQSWGWWFKTQPRPICRHCNGTGR